jgi:Stage II sporulation protein M
MKLHDHFLRYFLIAAFLLIAGILFVIIQTAVTNPGLLPLDPAALQARAEYHSSMLVPYMAGVFPRLLFANAGVALFILMVPLFWVWVWWFRRDLLDLVVLFMQATVCILMVALGHNSFTRVYLTYRLLSWQMIATMYLPHGWLEMLAFILAGSTAFFTIDALKGYLQENEKSRELHPGDICLFIFRRAWKAGLLVFALMAIAAAIECWITPVLVESAFKAALQNIA